MNNKTDCTECCPAVVLIDTYLSTYVCIGNIHMHTICICMYAHLLCSTLTSFAAGKPHLIANVYVYALACLFSVLCIFQVCKTGLRSLNYPLSRSTLAVLLPSHGTPRVSSFQVYEPFAMQATRLHSTQLDSTH